RENKNLRQQLRTKYTFKNMVGNSAGIQEVYQIMERVLNIDSTILITGETGTGKEMVAKAIHYSGNRAEQPFYALNCAGMQEQLLENELFGHEKGAFTGADRKKIGLFEAADRGSLFLDEISEANYSIQAKLLRVLQDKEFIRLGGLKPIKADVRLMAATNIDLEKAVAEGRFREDLFYRLNVVPVALPPLRERKDDILLLANYFLERYNEKLHREVSSFSAEALDLLMSHSWPGNVRELENAVERAVVLTQRDVILPEDLPNKVRGETISKTGKPSTYKEAKEEMLESFDKNFVIQALKETKGNITQAAKRVNLPRGSLQRIMKNYGIESKDYR
ncbi:MAG: sigma 54-interacting transcriptional regulator, partial [bacterium]|nr:sigma 54-interacting transcriptional regulator [bacterium]